MPTLKVRSLTPETRSVSTRAKTCRAAAPTASGDETGTPAAIRPSVESSSSVSASP